MRIRTPWMILLMAAFALARPAIVHAQPDPNDPPKAANPFPQPPLPGGPDWQKMTPQQRRQAVLQIADQTLRGSMNWLGYGDKPTQDAVVACMVEQEDAAELVRTAHRKVAQALLNNALPETQVSTLMADLRSAVEEARTKQETAMAALDAKVGFSKKPRLEAFLTMVGLIGDETSYLGGFLGSLAATLANVAAGMPANGGDAVAPGAVAPANRQGRDEQPVR